MKRKTLSFLLALVMASTMLTGCGNKESAPTDPVETIEETKKDEPVSEETEPEEETVEGCYRSELTNEWIDEELKDQRPIAVMVDHEITALPHYETANADIVYEIMNSLLNDRVTRFMCVIKDWKKIEQMGNIRSCRPSFLPLAGEWNAVVLHDGGKYMEDYMAQPWCETMSGGFLRVDNGKPTEFTEYVSANDKGEYPGIISRLKDANISEKYTEYYQGPHYQFSKDEIELSTNKNAIAATAVDFPFPHNESKLAYNKETGTYDYYVYGGLHQDAESNKVLTFKNVLIQKCDYHKLQDDGYFIAYDMNVSNMDGYYLTNGQAIPVKWTKSGDNEITRYYDLDGNEIKINTGKTYVALVPSDVWNELAIK